MSPGPPFKPWLVLRLASALALVALALCAVAASSAAAADPALEILTGTEAKTVVLQVCPKAGGVPHACTKTYDRPYLGGKLTVLLRSTAEGSGKVEIRFQPKSGTDPIQLSGTSKGVFLLGDVEDPVTMEPEESLSLTIGFVVPADESAATINGNLIVSFEGEKPQIVPVSGEAQSFKGVTIAPTTLPMDSEEGSATVTLEGPELVEYLRSHGSEGASAILYGDGSETGEVTLTLPAAGDVEVREHTNRARAKVTLADTPAAGKYTGKLSLANLPTETGSVSIELHAHESIWLLVFLVFIGIVTTGIGTRLVTAASRRKLLETVLNQTFDVFQYTVRRGKVRAWRLDDLLDEDTEKDVNQKTKDAPATPEGGRLQGLPALRDSIATARSSKDLDEDAVRVLDMVARMQRWLRVEPVARRLFCVAEKRAATEELPTEKGKDDADDKPALKWGDSKTLRDTRALLRMAQQEPADGDKADDLVARLLFQIEWHNRMATAWDAVGKGDDPKTLQKEARALDESLGDDSKPGKRELAELDGLTARLDALMGSLPEGARVPEPFEIDGEPLDEDGTKLGITKVKWDAAAHLFTGWATLDAQSYGQLSRRAATSSRGLYMPKEWADLRREICLVNRYDWAWTLAILIFTSAAYSATAYNDTWGSCADLATAFLAGSLGKVAVNWAALPIFQSIRLRKAEAS